MIIEITIKEDIEKFYIYRAALMKIAQTDDISGWSDKDNLCYSVELDENIKRTAILVNALLETNRNLDYTLTVDGKTMDDFLNCE